VLSGIAFNPDLSLNKVLFGDVEAILRDGGKDFIDALVPLDAAFGSGYVRVVDTEIPDTSNVVVFNVLDPAAIRPDNVVSDVKTGSATRSVAISPDGAFAYGVSPYANRVIPINLVQLAAWPSIPVGENPVAITLNPEGTRGYVANYVDGTVTIFDIDPNSPGHHDVVDAVGVGLAPTDLAIAPDGDRLVVVNYGSNDLSIVDTDPLSDAYHSVVSNPKTGSGTRTVAISPDGGLIYLGTTSGYLVMSATAYTVVSDVKTGNATRTVAITPDGAFLILLTSEGVVNIFDVLPESPTRDQVVASVRTGSGTSTVAISPDGGLLYLIQEASDIIIVAKLTVKSAVGVLEDQADLPATQLSVALVDTLTAGEDPAGIAFNTVTGEFVVTNAGDNTMSVFGFKGEMAGRVTTDSPTPGTGVPDIEIDAFETETGDLITTMITDDDGWFVNEMTYGDYVLTIVTPLGYTVAAEETLITFEPGCTLAMDFNLIPETIIPDTRKMSYWKHQLALALSGEGDPEVDGETLVEYLDLIAAHFNNNRVNPVEVYQPPESGERIVKLQVAKDLFNLRGQMTELAHAKQELMALLFNVSAGRLHLGERISRDQATASQAITYVDNMIDDGSTHNDKLARKIARDINHGKQIESGIIPIETPDIMYGDKPRRFSLEQNVPNPFNPATTIQFEVAEAVHVKLKVYDVAGRLVRTLVDETKKPDSYKTVWDGNDRHGRRVASGVYFYKLEAGSFVKTKKMVLLK
jgi:DNA-binding beta-propeller fold protein YncE